MVRNVLQQSYKYIAYTHGIYRCKYIKTTNDTFAIRHYYRDNSASELSTNHKPWLIWDK